MKKALFTTLFLIALLASLMGTAAAAPAVKSAALVSVDYTNKGPVFTFRVNDKFSKSELKGKLKVDGGGEYDVYCTQVDAETVACNTSKEVAEVNVTLFWDGQVFTAYVPGPREATSYCYGIWDYWSAEEYVNGWTNYGPYCQDAPAQEGDMVWYTVPDLNWDAPAWFFEDPSICEGVPNHGSAYYYDACGYYFGE